MMEKPNTRHYIGTPIRHVAPVCDCGNGSHKPGCACGNKGICEAVVDDANGVVYLYGNIKHEDYHVPHQDCLAYTGVHIDGIPGSSVLFADEVFEGEQDNNNVTLSHTPIEGTEVNVYLNGLKQIKGAEYDYTRSGNQFHFNFYELLPTDRVEITYKYFRGQ